MPRKTRKKISQARVRGLIAGMRRSLLVPSNSEWCRGFDHCARTVLDILGVPEWEPEKGKRHAD